MVVEGERARERLQQQIPKVYRETAFVAEEEIARERLQLALNCIGVPVGIEWQKGMSRGSD